MIAIIKLKIIYGAIYADYYKINKSVIMDLENTTQLIKLLEEEFICPIHQRPIQNPVITPGGISYEKEALEGWLDINATDPQTKNPLEKQNLIQNLALKGLITKIYKQIPTIQSQLAEKDQLITNLAQENAQLKKQLSIEKQKRYESEQFMDYSLEKTKKIRKIHEQQIGHKQTEKTKLRQKIKDISKLRLALNKQITQKKLITNELDGLKSENDRLKNQLRISRAQVQDITQQRDKIRGLIDEARKNSWTDFWHLKHTVQSMFKNITKITEASNGVDFTVESLKAIVDSGVEDILHNRQEAQIVSAGNSQRMADRIRLSYQELKNRMRIQRYLMNLQMDANGRHLNFKYELMNIGSTVGYGIKFLPFSQPPTQLQLQIDWSKVISIGCSFTQQTWELFMSQISKFPNLLSLSISQFTVTSFSHHQLSQLPRLKQLEIFEWSTVNQNQLQEIRIYRQSNPNVNIEFSPLIRDLL